MDEQRAKWRAYWHIKNGLDKGTLEKPSVCDNCGKRAGRDSFGRRGLQAHHYKGYSKKHYLDVLWLCPPCHHFAQMHGWQKLDGTRPGDEKPKKKRD